MSGVDDVAARVLKKTGAIDTFKLQKLVYYCQAWHLVWEGKTLFQAKIEAWANGPVVPKLYQSHKGFYQLSRWAHGDPRTLSKNELSTIDAVVDHYDKYSGWELAQLTHQEPPWADARREAGLGPGERGSVEIKPAAMLEYYGSLV